MHFLGDFNLNNQPCHNLESLRLISYEQGGPNQMATHCIYSFYRLTTPPAYNAVCQRADASLLESESAPGERLGFTVQLLSWRLNKSTLVATSWD